MDAVHDACGMVGGWLFRSRGRAARYDRQKIQLFINGAPAGSYVYTAAITASTNIFMLGCVHDDGEKMAGAIDEARVSPLALSTNWLWAEWLASASNDVFASYEPVETRPTISTRSPTAVSAAAARLDGVLWATGPAPAAVSVFWGEANAGTNGWGRTNAFAAPVPAGNLSTNVPVTAEREYWYRYQASNSFGAVWSPETAYLISSGVKAGRVADAAEVALVPGTFTVWRAGTLTNDALTVNFQLSGTASNGVDYIASPPDGRVTIPAGQTNAHVVVTPLWDTFYPEGTETVTLTLLPGGYTTGALNAASLLLTDAYVVANTTSGSWHDASIWASGHVPAPGEEIYVTRDVWLTNATAALGSLRLEGARLTVSNAHAQTQIRARDVVVRAGGAITHAGNTDTHAADGWQPGCRVYIVCTNLTVESGGAIAADGRGFLGGAPGRSRGCGPGGGSGDVSGSGGGSHGGLGGAGYGSLAVPGPVYGYPASPTTAGSGGAANSDSNPAGVGGAGGGIVRVLATGAARIDGLIAARGDPGTTNEQGGGAGGAICLNAGTLSGSGTLSAGGGAGQSYGGGGGGGRVAVYYADGTTFPASAITVTGGPGYAASATGSMIYAQLRNDATDTDGDGLTDYAEVAIHGTDFRVVDTDGDGLGDGVEVNLYRTDPLNTDSDNDWLPDVEELTLTGTSPTNADTDGDGTWDGPELSINTSPTNPASFGATISGQLVYAGVQSGAFWVSAARTGVVNQSGIFTGSTDYIEVPVVALATAYTLEAWVRFPLPVTAGGYRTVMQNGGGHHHVLVNSAGQLGVFAGSFYACGFNVTNLSAGWHLISAAASGAVTRFFVDGADAGTSAVREPNGVRYLGNYAGGDQQSGYADEFRIWNRPLLRSEILTYMRRTLSGDEPGLAGYWNFDDGTARDLTTNHFDGTLRNGAKIDSPLVPVFGTYLAALPAPGGYAITNVPTQAGYLLRGFRDANDNSLADPWEPQAAYANNPVLVAGHTNGLDLFFATELPPTAIPGGPYAVDEFTGDAYLGYWRVPLDGRASSDPVLGTNYLQYDWVTGGDAFAGTGIDTQRWSWSATGVVQGGSLTITGAAAWGSRWLASRTLAFRESAFAADLKVRPSGGSAMVGWLLADAACHYTNMPYAVYFNSDSQIYTYEDGVSQGVLGPYSPNSNYVVRIEVLPGAGVRYRVRPANATSWTLARDSTNGTDTTLRFAADVYSGTLNLDDLRDLATGAAPAYRFRGAGARAVDLIVSSPNGLSATATTSVTTSPNAPPTANAGDDKVGNEANGEDGIWTMTFSAKNSADDHGIYLYEWDWDYIAALGFRPSGVTGVRVQHVYDAATLLTNTVAVRVTDHALQSAIDTARVTLVKGAPPVADAGSNLVAEVGALVRFDGGGSTDDTAVARFAWAFGDGRVGSGVRPTHVYAATGVYTVVLVVYDRAGQASAPDTCTVAVVLSGGPTAVAGGPYSAGAGGPPAYFDGRGSYDASNGVSQGVVKYLWDADVSRDSDTNGVPDDDMDLVGSRPFYTYAAAGTYTAQLTVVDGANQSNRATALVLVASNLPPQVLCVPYHGNPALPHPAISGSNITLRAVVRDADAQFCTWDFGDGSLQAMVPVTNRYIVQTNHAYTGSTGRRITARLTVWDSLGQQGQDTFEIVILPDRLQTRADIAVDEGLWWLHKDQDKTTGRWRQPYDASSILSADASALHAFEINGHGLGGDPQEDPYYEDVYLGFRDLFSLLAVIAISTNKSPWGDPDANGNGLGIEAPGGSQGYEQGMVMDAVAVSLLPLAVAATGTNNIKGRTFLEILTDLGDTYAWGQTDSGGGRGGWRYRWNAGDADNSICQWAAIGLLAAEGNFGIPIPTFVKTENTNWLASMNENGLYGYSSRGYYPYRWYSVTPSALVQMIMDGLATTSVVWRQTEDFIADNWPIEGPDARLYYADYAAVKSFRLARPSPVVYFHHTGVDWYGDPVVGLRQKLVRQQAADKSWLGYAIMGGQYALGKDLSTAWAIIMLTPGLFQQPPVAVISGPVLWGFGTNALFTAERSFHIDPAGRIVKYEWDFNDDGTYEFATTNALDPLAVHAWTDPHPEALDDALTNVVRLKITDDNLPPQTDETYAEIVVRDGPHPPYARAGLRYEATENIVFALDGGGSFDIDPGDFITEYLWDLDNNGSVDCVTHVPRFVLTLYPDGIHHIALRVVDSGVGCPPGQRLTSEWDYADCVIEHNLPPVAEAGGPYTTVANQPVLLNGASSYDPNGDALTFAWDFNGDGLADSTAASPTNIWASPGTSTVRLTVCDSLLIARDTTTVFVLPSWPGGTLTVRLTSPAEGAVYPWPGVVWLAAEAGPTGGVARVEYYAGATKLGESMAPPYSFPWTNPPPGHHTLSGRAVSTLDITTNSLPVHIVVQPAWIAVSRLPTGSHVFRLFGENGRPYIVEASSNLSLSVWAPLGTNAPDGAGALMWTSPAPSQPQGFIRAREKP